MCKYVKDFKFCTCSEGLDVTDKSQYIWQLHSFIIHDENIRLVGKMILPKEYRGETITMEVVLEKLNSNSCFDFNYKASENDTFSLQIPNSDNEGGCLNAIYRNRQWIEGQNSPFSGKSKTINQGTLEFIK